MQETRKNHLAALIAFLVAVAVFGVARVTGVRLEREAPTAIADIR